MVCLRTTVNCGGLLYCASFTKEEAEAQSGSDLAKAAQLDSVRAETEAGFLPAVTMPSSNAVTDGKTPKFITFNRVITSVLLDQKES